MGAFIGEDPTGTWTLTICDDLAGDGGSLDSWSLDLTTTACAQPPAAPSESPPPRRPPPRPPPRVEPAHRNRPASRTSR